MTNAEKKDELELSSEPLRGFVLANWGPIERSLPLPYGTPANRADELRRARFLEFVADVDNAVAQDAALARCVEKNPESVKVAILRAALLGLRPGPVHKHFALTAFNSKRAKGGVECVGITEYRGLMEVANQAGALETDIRCEIVYDFDTKTEKPKKKGDPVDPPRFQYNRTTGEITHDYPLPDPHEKDKTMERAIAVYATCCVRGRKHPATVVLEPRDVHKRRAASAAWKMKGERSLWGTDPESMWKKSAIRALLDSGKVPMSRDILSQIEQAERESEAAAAPMEDAPEVVKPADVVVHEAEPAKPEPELEERPAAEPVAEEPAEKPAAKRSKTFKGKPIVESEYPPDNTAAIWRNPKTGKLYAYINGTWSAAQ